jgi:hypothetical protein
MDKSNIAFGLITAILALYIAVALILSRSGRAETHKTGSRGAANHKQPHYRAADHTH